MTKTSTALSPITPKRATAKSTASTSKTRARVTKESPLPEPVLAPPPDLLAGVTERLNTLEESPLPEPVLAPPPDLLAGVTERLNTLEEKIVGELSSLTAEIQALKTAAPEVLAPDGTATTEIFLPVVADLIRRNLMEQMNPVIASLKRLEERVGFMSNRLRQPPPAGPDHRQQKPPWRHDQQQRHNRPRGPRPGGGGSGGGSGSSGSSGGPPQGQSWTPPSAASVQGHFAPRPLHGGESGIPRDDEE